MLTVGDYLRQTREKNAITLTTAAKDTRIQEKYLRALEANQWNMFTSKVYMSGLLRTYGTYLGLDSEHVLAYFRRDYEKKEVMKFRKRLPSLSFLPETRKIIIITISTICFLFAAYFGYLVYLSQLSPQLEIIAPTKTVFRNTEKITILGKTQKESTIRIYGQDIFPDKNGRFSYEFPLKKGENTVHIQVTGANGKKSIISRNFILE